LRGVETLTEAMFSLDEPWRGRFLDLVANLATGEMWDGGRRPGREEVTTWLGTDYGLYQEMMMLVDAWRRPRIGRLS